MSAVPSTDLLKGKRVLLTGAGGTLGGGITRALRQHGAEVHGVDLKAGEGIRACNVTDAAAFEAVYAAIAPSDVVHAAGTLIVSSMADTEPDDFRRAMENNLMSAFVVGREAARRLESGGALVLIASQAAYRAGALWGPYCAVKAGVLRLSEALAKELGPKGIRVNSVCPNPVESPMIDEAIAIEARYEGVAPETVRARLTAGIPLGRFSQPDDVGAACAYLLSPLASYISGIALPVDGGEVSW